MPSSMQVQKIKVGICPICGNEAKSSHHIKPIRDGGSDEERNKVLLCKRCHDIVELIYGETRLEYSPTLVQAIQREFGFPLNNEYKTHSKVIKFSKREKKSIFNYSDAYTVCSNCGVRFYRGTETHRIYCDECTELGIQKFLASKASDNA